MYCQSCTKCNPCTCVQRCTVCNHAHVYSVSIHSYHSDVQILFGEHPLFACAHAQELPYLQDPGDFLLISLSVVRSAGAAQVWHCELCDITVH